MRRQQAVLVALARQVDPIGLLSRIPELLDLAKQNLWTTVPRADFAGMAKLAARGGLGSVKQVLFAPPSYPEHLDPAAIDGIRAVVGSVFDDWSTAWPAVPTQSAPCPAPV